MSLALKRRFPRTTDEWLNMRSGRVTSSLLAAVLGLDPWKTPYQAWLEIKGLASFEGNKATQRGSALEGVVLDYPTRGGHLTRKPAPFVQIGDWAGDSTDCLYLQGERLLLGEAKTCGGVIASRYGVEGTDDIPQTTLVQCCWHLLAWPAADQVLVPILAADGFTFEFREYCVERDDDLIGTLAEAAERWWVDHVLADVAPLVTFADNDALQEQHPRHTKDQTIEPTDEVLALVGEKLAAAAAKTTAEKLEADAVARLRAALGDAEGCYGEGWKVTWKNNRDGERTDWEALARDLGATEADIKKHTHVTPGARVLRVWKKKPKAAKKKKGRAA